MPLSNRTRPVGRFGRTPLDPSRPLYVCRRISRGAAGALRPGQVFDPTGVSATRLRQFYFGGYIAHEPPKTIAQAVSAALARGAAQAAQATADVPPPAAPATVAPSLAVQEPAAKSQPKPLGRRSGA